MATMKFSSNFNTMLREAESFFHELQQPPVALISALEKELSSAYLDTQAAAHVLTGSLKASGRTSSDYHGNMWEGSITYGGPSTGVNNPVTYAIYEMARGGEHDFLQPARAHEPRMEAILSDWPKYFGGK